MLETVAIIVNIILVAIIVYNSFRLMLRWKRRKWLAVDFFGMGSSYLLLMICVTLWFLTLNQTYFLLAAVWSIFWAISYSYATLRIVHPHEKRPANWALLMFVSAPIVWLVTRDIMLTAIQILLLSSLVFFTSSLLLHQLCRKVMKKYAIAGMLIGIIRISFVTLLVVPVTVAINITNGFLIILSLNALFAYIVFGFLQTAQKHPKDFLCDYDHRKDRRKK